MVRRLDCGNVNLFHLHHRIERPLGGIGIGIVDRSRQGDRRNLPGQSPFVLAPAARALLTAVADDGVPVAIRFVLVNSRDLKRERFVMSFLLRYEPPEAGVHHALAVEGHQLGQSLRVNPQHNSYPLLPSFSVPRLVGIMQHVIVRWIQSTPKRR